MEPVVIASVVGGGGESGSGLAAEVKYPSGVFAAVSKKGREDDFDTDGFPGSCL